MATIQKKFDLIHCEFDTGLDELMDDKSGLTSVCKKTRVFLPALNNDKVSFMNDVTNLTDDAASFMHDVANFMNYGSTSDKNWLILC
jgi:hypothetical protein